MGGIGSGRWDCRANTATVDELRTIDVRRWAREGLIQDGNRFGWEWRESGSRVASIQAHITSQQKLRLSYNARVRGGDWQSMDYAVHLDWTACHFGNARPWFLCPAHGCGRRVAKLYGGVVFPCRHCHRLTYPSQRESPSERATRRCGQLRRRLGWSPGPIGSIGPKPTGMHWETFARLVERIEADANTASLLQLEKLRKFDLPERLLRELQDVP